MPKKKSLPKTKLVTPYIKGKILRREKLLNVLGTNFDKELIILCADAGFGKTTLLSQFCAELDSPYFFYALEPSDSDLTTLFEHILIGMTKEYRNFGKRTLSILGKTGDIEILTGTFINDFYEGIDEPFYAIFDDYQNLHNSTKFDLVLDYLLSHAPPNFRIIIASRITPRLDLTRYLARQQLLKIEREQLKFDFVEIETLLKDIYQFKLSKKEIARIENHSEGWITAIQLIMQKIVALGEQNAPQALDGYIASGKEIFKYFAQEVFERQSEKIKRFLVETSIFKNITPEICDEFLNIKNSTEILKKLENGHVFVSRMKQKIYRYNRLFHDYLIEIAGKHYSRKELSGFNIKLGDILRRRFEFEPAIEHYLKGGKYQAAITCIKKVAFEIKPSGIHRKIMDWLANVPEKYIDNDLDIVLIKAEALDFFYEIEEALKLYRVVEQRAQKEHNAKMLIAAANGISKIYVSSRKFDEALKYIKKSYRIGKKYSIDKRKLIKIYNLEGICHDYLGDLEKAETAYNKGLDIIEKYNAPKKDYAYLLNNITILSYIKGDFNIALRDFRELIRTDPNPLNHSTIHSNIASVLLDLGYFKETRKALKDAYTCSKQYMNKRAYLMFLYTLANYYLEISEFDKAELYYNQLMNMSRDYKEEFTENVGKAGLMKTYYGTRNYAKAHRISNKLFSGNGMDLHIHTHGMFLYRALVELCSKKPRKAELTLLGCLRWIERTKYKFSRMMNYYYLGYLYYHIKNEKKALLYIEKALEIARAHRYDHTIIHEGIKESAFVQFALKKSRFHDYIDDIMLKMYRQKGCVVNFFGKFRISINCMPIHRASWQTEKARLIFAYLVFNKSRAVSKDELISEFYEESNISMANQNIRKTISRIRGALMWDRIIIQTRGAYKINPMIKFNIDTEKFESLVEDILNRRGDVLGRSAKKYHQLTRLYHGDFLSDFQNDWCARTRKRFKDCYIKALEILSRQFNDHGELENARHASQEISRIK